MKKRNIIIIAAAVIVCLAVCIVAFAGKSGGAATAQITESPAAETETEIKRPPLPKSEESENPIVRPNTVVPNVVYVNEGSGVESMSSEDTPQSTATPQPTTTPQPTATPKPTATPAVTAAPEQRLSELAQEYADYCALSSEEQYAYYKLFASADEFMQWYNAAKAAYDRENQVVVLEPGAAIDLGS